MDFEKEIKKLIPEGNQTKIINTLNTYLLRAYNRGWNDSLWGDDATSIDAQSNEEILLRIKTEATKKTRTSDWERIDIYEPAIIHQLNTQKLYQKAIRFAGEKHSSQTMPGSEANYLVHLSNVAMEVLLAYQTKQDFDVDFAVQIAILHDTIEDTNTTYNELLNSFGYKIANAVQALSKNPNIKIKKLRMEDSLERILKLEKEVGLVKLADRITNLQPPPAHWNNEKIIKYKDEAKNIFDKLKHCNIFLSHRLQTMINSYQDN